MKLQSNLVPWLIVSLILCALGIGAFFIFKQWQLAFAGGGLFGLGVVGCLVIGVINKPSS
jgi:hypothetical protein